MEAPISKWYTPFKRGRFMFYRFSSKFMTGDCSIEIIKGKAIIKSGGVIRLIVEASGRYVYFKLAEGVLPSTKYRADVYSDRIELIWE
jgi:hypothetical protein